MKDSNPNPLKPSFNAISDTVSLSPPALPSSIRIMGHTYKVELKDDLLKDQDQWGTVNTRTQTIEIDSGAAYNQQLLSLFHEMLEVIDEHLGLEMDHKILQAIAACFFAVLNDNAGRIYFQPGLEEWHEHRCTHDAP